MMPRIEGPLLTYAANALLQVPFIVLVAAILARLMHRAPARFVHALWLAAVLLAVLLPATALAPQRRPAPQLGAAAWAPGSAGAVSIAIPPAALPPPGAWGAPLRRGLAIAFLLAWGLAALRLARAAAAAARLRRAAWPVVLPMEFAAMAQRCRRALGLAGEVEILVSAERTGPVTVGILRPAVLLPADSLAALSPRDFAAALSHELAHVRRGDPAISLASELLLLPLAWHPATWVLRRAVARSREMACDELAATSLLGPREYARALLGLAAIFAGLPRPSTTLGVVDANNLEDRMHRLTAQASPFSTRRARLALVAGLSAMAALAWAASSVAVAVAAPADLPQLAGTWRGSYDEGPGKGLPGATLTVSVVDGAPRVAVTLIRYLKDEKGALHGNPAPLPVIDQAYSDGVVRFRTRDDNFRFKGGTRTAVDYDWTFTLAADGRGILTVVANSYFKTARERSEAVPPPMPMQRDR